jgi:hypothetical protein
MTASSTRIEQLRALLASTYGAPGASLVPF